jgi:hypothetical protein
VLFNRLVSREIVKNTVSSPSVVLPNRLREVDFSQEYKEADLRPLRLAVEVFLVDSLPEANLVAIDDIAVL